MAYTYASYTASNGVVLNTIKTSPNNIYIKYIGAVPVTGQSTTGVNGGTLTRTQVICFKLL